MEIRLSAYSRCREAYFFMSGTQQNRSPAGAILAAFAVGLLLTGILLAGSAGWMAKQELSQTAAWSFSTAAVCIGTFVGGWFSAFLQKSRGLVCGAIEGLLMAGLLLVLMFGYGGVLHEMQELRCAMILCSGCTGGFCGMLRAEGRLRASR